MYNWNIYPNTELNLDESLHSPAFPYWYLPLIDTAYDYVYSVVFIPEMKYSISENVNSLDATFLYTTANYALKSQMWDATYSAGEWSVMGNNQAMRLKTTDLSVYQARTIYEYLFTSRIYITNMLVSRDSALSSTFFPTLTLTNNLFPVFTYYQLTSAFAIVKNFGLYQQIVSWAPGLYRSNLVALFDGMAQTSRPECVMALPDNFSRQSFAVALFADKCFSATPISTRL